VGVLAPRRVIEAALAGSSLRPGGRAAPRRVSTVIGRVGRPRDSGELSARRQGRPRGLNLDPHEDSPLPLIEAEPDMTIERRRTGFGKGVGVEAGNGSIWTFLGRCRLP
jgi:transposase